MTWSENSTGLTSLHLDYVLSVYTARTQRLGSMGQIQEHAFIDDRFHTLQVKYVHDQETVLDHVNMARFLKKKKQIT